MAYDILSSIGNNQVNSETSVPEKTNKKLDQPNSNSSKGYSIMESIENIAPQDKLDTTDIEVKDELESFVSDVEQTSLPDEEEDDEPSFLRSAASDVGGFISSGEIISAPLEGATRALGEVTQTISSVGNWLEDTLNVGRVTFTDRKGNFDLGYMNRDEVKQAISEGIMQESDFITGGTSFVLQEVDDVIPDSETMTGAMTSGITQFATGMVLTRGVGSKLGPVTSAMTRGAITDAAFFDPDDDNLANLSVATGGAFDNILSQSLAKGEDNSEFEKRAKNAFEGLIIGGAFEGVLRTFRNAKAVKEAKADIEVNGELSPAKAQAVDDSVDALDQWMKRDVVGPSQKDIDAAKLGPSKPKGLGSRSSKTTIESSDPDVVLKLQKKLGAESSASVSYTHLTLPTKRIV